MSITIDWHNGDQFNVAIATKEGMEPYLTVKGCRLANGSKGPFVSWPATKNQSTGKYWSHVWASEKFAAVVLSMAQETQPKQEQSRRPSGGGGGADMDVPFAPLRF